MAKRKNLANTKNTSSAKNAGTTQTTQTANPASTTKGTTETLNTLLARAQGLGHFNLTEVSPSRHNVVNLGEVPTDVLERIRMTEEQMLQYSDASTVLDDFVVVCDLCEGRKTEPVMFYYRRYNPGAISLDASGAPCSPEAAALNGLYEAYCLDTENCGAFDGISSSEEGYRCLASILGQAEVRSLYESSRLELGTYDISASFQIVRHSVLTGQPEFGASLARMRVDWLRELESAAPDTAADLVNTLMSQAMALFAYTQYELTHHLSDFHVVDKEKLARAQSGVASMYADRVKRSVSSAVRRVYTRKEV